MLLNTTDPHQLVLVGENPFMMAMSDDLGSLSTAASLWRVRFSPAGAGHVLYLKSELSGGDVRIYADNIALARWIQAEVMSPRLPFTDLSVSVVEAEFGRTGDIPWFVTETVRSDADVIQLTWFDFLPPYNGKSEPSDDEIYGHSASYVPARGVRVVYNGVQMPVRPQESQRDGYAATSCFLAQGESWVRVRGDAARSS